MIALTVQFDFIRFFSLLELTLIVIYLALFVGILIAIAIIGMRLPTMLWSPTETTCALCGNERWCREFNGRMVCPECRIDIHPPKRWWEL